MGIPDLGIILYFIALALATFWALSLLGVESKNRIANKFLSSLLFLISLDIISSILDRTQLILEVPYLVGVTWPFAFIYPQLFYFYVKSITGAEIQFKRHVWHFLPFLVDLVILIPFYLQSTDDKIAWLDFYFENSVQAPATVSILILAQESIYFVLSLFALNNHSRKIKQTFSTLGRKTLRWLVFLMVAYMAVILLFSFLNFSNYQLPDISAPLTCSFFIYVLGFMALRQPAVFVEANNTSASKKYEKSSLTSEKAGLYQKRLIHLMESEKPFLDIDLTLSQLASRVGISPNHLSQVLNESLRQSFFDFVTTYRVEEAKKGILNPANKHLTILAIAYEAGFTSKSSFNSAFKKHTGMTPTQFKKTHATLS